MHLDLMRDKAGVFPDVPQPEKVRSARVWHCRYRTLQPLSALRRLETLVIATYPDDTLAPLGRLSGLRCLSILHLPKVGDLSPLRSLRRLEALSLATIPSWDSSGKVQVVASLGCLAGLPRLRHLELFGVVPRDRSLAPLHECTALVSARISKFPKQEVERFYEVSGVSNAFNPPPVFLEGVRGIRFVKNTLSPFRSRS